MMMMMAQRTDVEAPLLEVRKLEKAFGPTKALKDVSLDVRKGEIHALLGANGAGKSTVSKVITGHFKADAGEMLFKGTPLELRSTRDALTAGIAIVMQETSLAADMTVLENIFLPEFGTPGRLSYAAMRHRAEVILEQLGQTAALSLDTEVRALSSAQRQLVEIAKALAIDAELIIFDEPTASLSRSEVERLFDVMNGLKAAGRALIFVSHRLEEVLEITDRVTVMREGITTASGLQTATLTQAEIIRLLVGRDLNVVSRLPESKSLSGTDPIFEVREVVAAPAVRGVSFSVRPGEILGLGGLVGAGRSEVAEAIFGMRPRGGGEIFLDSKKLRIRKPADAIRAGIGFVPEDRRLQNIVPDFSVKENLLLAHIGARRGFGLGHSEQEAKIHELLARLELPAHRLLDDSMLNFSGGMQQKIIIARWLLIEPKVLILDEPTKGVDIGTRQSIYEILRDIAARGVAVVVISSDFAELLSLSTRVVVISDGVSVANLPASDLDEERLMLLAAPRASMQRNGTLVEDLANEFGGAAFWALIDDDRLICLNSSIANAKASPCFDVGELVLFEKSSIPLGLARRGSGFVTEPDGSRTTIAFPLRSRRDHDLGWIGVIVEGGAPQFSPDDFKQRIEQAHD